MRSILSVLSGCIAAAITYWFGAAATLVMIRGIPLGSSGGPATRAEITVHLALAAVAGFLGAALAMRSARGSPGLHAGAVGLLLGIGALTGFGKPGNQWPQSFGVTMATACAVGVMSAIAWRRRRTLIK